MTGTKSDDPLHIDYVPVVFAFVPVAGVLRKRKSVDRYERSQEHAKNQYKKEERKDFPNKNETALYVNVEYEYSVLDYVKQIEFEIVADKGTQTEEVIRHTLSEQKLKKTHLLKKQVKTKNAQIIFSYENTRESDLKFLTATR